MSPPAARRELVQSTLAVVFLLALLGTCFWILRPVMPALLWSIAIAVSTWPLLLGLERRLGGSRTAAAFVLALLLTILLLGPVLLGVLAIVDNAAHIGDWLQTLPERGLPQPPGWIERLPFAGARIAQAWRTAIENGPEGLFARLGPYGTRIMTWSLGKLGGAGVTLVQFALTLVGVVFFYRNGEALSVRLRQFARRVAGEQGEGAVVLAAQATRSVALGVLVTAVVQALLATLGLLVARVPSTGILSVVIIVLGIAHLGPMPVLIPTVIWLYVQGATWRATGLLIWSGVVSVVDNVLRPFLIRRGADLPIMLIFVGVIGGLVAFGVVGLFIGPVVLAVAYRLLEAWLRHETAEASDEPVSGGPPVGARTPSGVRPEP
jgi:predicted PurR-regulated permease PerM